MPQYVVRKIGFLYSDEFIYPDDSFSGSVIEIFSSLDKAKDAKHKLDFASLQHFGMYQFDIGHLCQEAFGSREKFRPIAEKIVVYFKTEFDEDVNIQNVIEVKIPKTFSEEQAIHLLGIMDLSFHQIVEFSDDTVISIGSGDDPLAFEVDEF